MCDDVDHGGRRCPSSTAEGQRRRRAGKRTADADAQLEAFIGATPFRPVSGELMRMSSRPSYYDSEEWTEYDDSLRASAERHGIEIVDAEDSTHSEGVIGLQFSTGMVKFRNVRIRSLQTCGERQLDL